MADELPHKERSINLHILIGNNYYDDIMKTDKLEIDKWLYLMNSSLGWMFSGRIPSSTKENNEYSHNYNCKLKQRNNIMLHS